MTSILLDTDVIINLLKKDTTFVEKFLGLYHCGAKFYCNPIVIAEVYAGVFEKEIDIKNLIVIFHLKII